MLSYNKRLEVVAKASQDPHLPNAHTVAVAITNEDVT